MSDNEENRKSDQSDQVDKKIKTPPPFSADDVNLNLSPLSDEGLPQLRGLVVKLGRKEKLGEEERKIFEIIAKDRHCQLFSLVRVTEAHKKRLRDHQEWMPCRPAAVAGHVATLEKLIDRMHLPNMFCNVCGQFGHEVSHCWLNG